MLVGVQYRRRHRPSRTSVLACQGAEHENRSSAKHWRKLADRCWTSELILPSALSCRPPTLTHSLSQSCLSSAPRSTTVRCVTHGLYLFSTSLIYDCPQSTWLVSLMRIQFRTWWRGARSRDETSRRLISPTSIHDNLESRIVNHPHNLTRDLDRELCVTGQSRIMTTVTRPVSLAPPFLYGHLT